jgi:predicted cobalt transporter CbtA
MIRSLLIRGMVAGVVAGLLAFGFARTFGEPSVARAIAFEQAHERHVNQTHVHEQTTAADASHDDNGGGEELVSRPTQAGIGLLTGVVVFGAALGGLFSLVFALAYGRLGTLDAHSASALLAVFGFVCMAIVPAMKYPPNPPSIGNPETIGLRTVLFFVMVATSIASMVLAVWLQRRLQAHHGGFNAALMAGAVYIALVVGALVALPTIDEVPVDFSASLLWRFRLASIGIQAVLWTTIGLVFGAAATRELKRPAHRRMSPA